MRLTKGIPDSVPFAAAGASFLPGGERSGVVWNLAKSDKCGVSW